MLAPELARAGVAFVVLVGKLEVDAGYIWWEDGGAGAGADLGELVGGGLVWCG